jgi:hypothetical protein
MTAEEKFGVPYDIFGRPYTKETYLWWRSLSEEQRLELLVRRAPYAGKEGVERLLREYGKSN